MSEANKKEKKNTKCQRQHIREMFHASECEREEGVLRIFGKECGYTSNSFGIEIKYMRNHH